MLIVEKARAYDLPDGSFIKIETCGGPKEDFEAINIILVNSKGFEAILCSVDYDREDGLRTLVFSEKDEEPVFVQKYIEWEKDKIESIADVERRLNDGIERTWQERELCRKWLTEYMEANQLSLKQLDDMCWENSDWVFEQIFGGEKI